MPEVAPSQVSKKTRKRRPRCVLDLNTKIEILERLKAGEGCSAVGRAMGLNESTVRTIRSSEDAIRATLAAGVAGTFTVADAKNRNTYVQQIEHKLNDWIYEMTAKGRKLHMAKIRGEAKKMYDELMESRARRGLLVDEVPFQASKGWFRSFKARYGHSDIVEGKPVEKADELEVVTPKSNVIPFEYVAVELEDSDEDVPQQVQQQSQSGGGQQGGGGGGGGQAQQQANPSSPSPVVPIAPKKVAGSSGVAQQQTPVAAQQPPPEVCLRWNSYYSNMQATFPSLLNNEQFVDVTLACEGRSIKCHKVMLSACSSYFEELLSQNPCQHPIVFMRDLKFWEVQALVEFMYSGEVNVAQDRLPSLLAAAEALQIKGLTGPSNSSSSHDEDSLPVPEIEESPSQYLQKRPRKRKMPSTPAYHQPKSQLIGPMTPSVKQQQVKVPMNVGSHSQVVGAYASPALAAAVAAATQSAPAAHSQSRVPSPREHHPHHPIHLSKIKRETSSPITVVKQEPIDMSTDYSQGDSDTGQSTEHEMSAVDCTTTITVEPGPIGLTVKGHHNQQHQSQQQQQQQHQQQQQNDNGLSEDDDHTESSNCSEDQQRFASQQHQPHQTDTGESGGGGASSSV